MCDQAGSRIAAADVHRAALSQNGLWVRVGVSDVNCLSSRVTWYLELIFFWSRVRRYSTLSRAANGMAIARRFSLRIFANVAGKAACNDQDA